MKTASSAEARAYRALEANKRRIGNTKTGTVGARALERRQQLRERGRVKH